MYLYIYLYIRHWPKTPPAVQYWGSCWRHSLSGPFRPRVFVEDLFVPGLPCWISWGWIDFLWPSDLSAWSLRTEQYFHPSGSAVADDRAYWLCGGRQPRFRGLGFTMYNSLGISTLSVELVLPWHICGFLHYPLTGTVLNWWNPGTDILVLDYNSYIYVLIFASVPNFDCGIWSSSRFHSLLEHRSVGPDAWDRAPDELGIYTALVCQLWQCRHSSDWSEFWEHIIQRIVNSSKRWMHRSNSKTSGHGDVDVVRGSTKKTAIKCAVCSAHWTNGTRHNTQPKPSAGHHGDATRWQDWDEWSQDWDDAWGDPQEAWRWKRDRSQARSHSQASTRSNKSDAHQHKGRKQKSQGKGKNKQGKGVSKETQGTMSSSPFSPLAIDMPPWPPLESSANAPMPTVAQASAAQVTDTIAQKKEVLGALRAAYTDQSLMPQDT